MTEEIKDYNYTRRDPITNLHTDISYCEVNKCDAVQRLKQENNNIKKRNEEWAKETIKQAGQIAGLEFNIDRLEQENKDFEILAKSLYKRIEELEKENEALVFREILYKADYEASEQENKELKSALEEIKELNEPCADCKCNTACGICSVAENKPYSSYHIANEVLDNEYNG